MRLLLFCSAYFAVFFITYYPPFVNTNSHSRKNVQFFAVAPVIFSEVKKGEMLTESRKERQKMTTEGFIKLPRTMLEWGWLDDGNTLKVYLVLLLSANWKDAEWHGIKLKRGQLITSYPKLAEKCSLSVQEIRTAFNHLKSTGDITVKTTSKFSIVTVNNYDVPEEATDNSTDKSIVKQQADNIQSTVNRQTVNSQSTTEEERKEEKEIKEKEEREAASPFLSPSPFNSSNSSEKSVTRDGLIAEYGVENVLLYENKFESWAAKKGITDCSNMYKVIAKWLVEDNIKKPRRSSFEPDEVMQKIIARYKS